MLFIYTLIKWISHFICYLQMYRLNVKGQLAVGERCIESPSGDSLHLSFCDTQPTGPWFWDEVSCCSHWGLRFICIARSYPFILPLLKHTPEQTNTHTQACGFNQTLLLSVVVAIIVNKTYSSIEGLQVLASPEALCCVLEQDTLFSTL